MRDKSFLYAYLVSLVASVFCVLFLATIRLSGVAFISWIGIIAPIIIVDTLYCFIFIVILFVLCFQDIASKRKNRGITKDLKDYF